MRKSGNFLVLVILFITLLSIPVSAGERKVKRIHVSVNPMGAYFIINGISKAFFTPCYIEVKKDMGYELTFFKDGFKSKVIDYSGNEGDISVYLDKEESDDNICPGYEELDDVIGNENYEMKKDKKRKKVDAEITTEPANAFFTIEGSDKVYTAPETVKFKKNKEYTIVFKLKGFKNKKVKYTGGEGDLHVDLIPKNYVLKINSNVENANIIIDGKNIGKTPLKIEMEPGYHMVKIKKDGYKTYKKEININKHNMKLNVELADQPVLKVKLPNGAKIYVNGKQRKINWAKINKEWKTIKLKSNKDVNEVMIEYYGNVLKKDFYFDNRTIVINPDDFVRKERHRKKRNRYVY